MHRWYWPEAALLRLEGAAAEEGVPEEASPPHCEPGGIVGKVEYCQECDSNADWMKHCYGHCIDWTVGDIEVRM